MLVLFMAACSVQRKLDNLEKGQAPTAKLALGKEAAYIPKVGNIVPEKMILLK